MKLTPFVVLAFTSLAVASAACGARVAVDPAPASTDDPSKSGDTPTPAVDGAVLASDASDASDASAVQVDAAADVSEEAGGICTADMLASIKTSCFGAASGEYYTGLLDFACAGTTATAADRDAQIAMFCSAHKVGEAVHADLAEGGTGFYCFCFVA